MVNKSVLNHLQLFEFLKWNTDENHPLTQKKLRDKFSEDKVKDENKDKSIFNCLGDKKTFRNRLATLVAFCNSDSNTSNGHIFCNGIEQDSSSNFTSKGTRVKGFFYKHDITTSELDFIIHQIDSTTLIDDARKERLESELIHVLGNIFYYDQYRSRDNLRTKTFHFFNTDFPLQYFSIIDDAIRNNKMVTFKVAILDADGKLVVPNKHSKKPSHAYTETKHAPKPGSTRLVVSPYNIVLYKGIYFLIGNRLLSYNPRAKSYSYSSNFEVFRMDRIIDLDFEYRKNASSPINSKSFYEDKQQILLDNKVMIYKNGVAINRRNLSQNYGEVKFKIIWKNFSNSFPFIERNDYTFIQNTFGNYYTVDTSGPQPIVCVYTCEDCFIDWALVYINRIEILDDENNEMVARIKQKLEKILIEGLQQFKHNAKSTV